MFKSARWRSDKNKIKAVFKLQFYATQVAELGENALTISVVPGDVGKPTIRLDKATIQNRCCRWANPVYETVKFVKEPKTGKITEKIYQFIVSTGSSKAGILGEVSIDFADYAEATKASSISLPLKNSRSKAVLHVSIQRLQQYAGLREIEDYEDVNFQPEDRSLRTQLSNGDSGESIKSNSIEDKITSDTSLTSELNGNRSGSTGSDITLSSSESGSGLNTPRELGMRDGNLHQDSDGFLSSVTNSSLAVKPIDSTPGRIYDEQQRSQWGWSASSDQQASDIGIEKLKSELVALARQAELSELELQTLRKQIVKESKRGQDLTREVTSLKEERNLLKAECERLKTFQKRIDEAKVKDKMQFECGDSWVLLEEIRQELNYEKDLNANLRLQLQKTQESNNELILAVQDLDDMLEQKNKEIANPSNKSSFPENSKQLRRNICRSETDDDDEEQKALEDLVKEHRDARDSHLLEQKIMDLYSEIEIYRRDKDELEMQMEQLALDYEILKQENHDMSCKLEQSLLQDQLKMQCECSQSSVNISEFESKIQSLESELKKQSKDYSESLVTIKKLKSHIKNLEDDLEKQAEGYEADLEAVTHMKVEQEQRAICAEEALRNTRLKNVNTAERLQEEFKRLSIQMASTFDANEKVATRALAEASDLRAQKSQLEDMLKKAREELGFVRDDYERKLHELSAKVTLKENQIEQVLEEIANKSKQLEQQKAHEEEVSGTLSMEIRRLKSEIEKLRLSGRILSEKAKQGENLRVELEKLKSSIEENEMLVERGNVERNELVSAIALLKKEAKKSQEELQRLRKVKDEVEATVELLKSELEMHKAQCDDLKHSLFEDEKEKEKLRKQVFQVKSDLKKKEDSLTSLEKKLKDSNRRALVSDGARATRNGKLAPQESKEIASLREKLKLLEGKIKSKEIALNTSTNSFLEKENDLLKKIEELESRVEELNQDNADLYELSLKKVVLESNQLTSNGDLLKENGNASPLVKSDENKEVKLGETLSELASLKEQNKSMASELKEMQERYSEISLKFAEVEGERQKLVMTLRNLKNSKKN